MKEPRFQLSADTWAYVDQARSKLVVEIDLPQGTDAPGSQTSEDQGTSAASKLN